MIIGKVHASPHDFYVQKMKVGDRGFIHTEYIIVTRTAIFLDILTPVIQEDDMDAEDEVFENFIPITRVGEGLNEEDFDLDFSDSDRCIFCIDGNAIHTYFMKEKKLYVVFSKFEIGRNRPAPEEPKETIEDLEAQLRNAIADDDFEVAAELRNMIALKKSESKTNL